MRNNVTSSATIFWKFFFPTFWTVFFTTLTLGIIFTDIKPTGIPKSAFTTLMCITLGLGIILFYMTIIRLKKVEMDGGSFYVTNYFKWYKYSYGSIDRIIEKDLMLVKIITIKFKEKSKFGKKVFFLANHRALNEFLKENPEVTQQLFEAEA